MKILLNSFYKTLGFLFSVLFFIFLLTTISIFLMKDKEKEYFSYFSGNDKSNKKIAILNIGGPIISEPTNLFKFEFYKNLNAIYPSLIEQYLKILEKEKILALVIAINSQGGSVSASHKIYNLIKKFKKKNNIKVYFHSSEILASGGYWIALSGDKIFANYGAIIGSIGVKGPDWIYYNSPTLISTGILGGQIESPNGIELYSNKAGQSKDIFNPFRKPSKNEQKKLQIMVDDIYDDFINIVSRSRKIEKNIIINDIGAMIFNSKQAKKNFLIDNQLYLSEVTNLIINEMKIDSPIIIINKKNKKNNILNLNTLLNPNIFLKQKEYSNLIKSKFCNNLLNGFSSALIDSYKSNC